MTERNSTIYTAKQRKSTAEKKMDPTRITHRHNCSLTAPALR